MADKTFKPIEEITESELQELWPLIGGVPHLFEYGKDELKEGLSTGSFESVNVDYYTMAAIVDYLRSKGYEAGMPPMRPEDHEQVEINKAAGMPDNEASFQSGYTAGHDAGSGKGEWDSQRMVGRVQDRFKELEAKGWEWRSFYNGWLEGRADMFAQVKGIGKYKESGKEEAVAFGEWMAKQNYRAVEGSWYKNGNTIEHSPKTTSQLYGIFKQKNK